MLYIAELGLKESLKEEFGEKIDICVDSNSKEFREMEEAYGHDFFFNFMNHDFDVVKEDLYTDVKKDPRYNNEMDLEKFATIVSSDHKADMEALQDLCSVSGVGVYFKNSGRN